MRTLDLQTDKMLAHVDEGVGSIIFNQPEKRNAVSYAMCRRYRKSLRILIPAKM